LTSNCAAALSVRRRLQGDTSQQYLLLIAFVLAFSSLPAIAQTPDPHPPGPPPDPARPPLNPFPAEQNWSFLADSAKRTDLFDPAKYIRLGESPQGKGLDYNWEPAYQWGNFGSGSIRAWSVSTETGFTFDRLRFQPRPLLRANVYSGDGNAAGQNLGTFNPLFPRGAYFTPKALPFLGPQNLVDLHPVLQFHLKPNVTGAFAWNWYWRESTHDGIYAFGSGILIDPAGHQPCAISRHPRRS
jgi:hypothetical protein